MLLLARGVIGTDHVARKALSERGGKIGGGGGMDGDSCAPWVGCEERARRAGAAIRRPRDLLLRRRLAGDPDRGDAALELAAPARVGRLHLGRQRLAGQAVVEP